MSRFGTFLLGMVAGGLLYAAATNFHVLRGRDGFHLVAKQSPRLSETYVDVRQFTLADWTNHPQLAAALAKANKQYLIGESAAASLPEGVNQLIPAWPDQ
jgi:hypothetical protein